MQGTLVGLVVVAAYAGVVAVAAGESFKTLASSLIVGATAGALGGTVFGLAQLVANRRRQSLVAHAGSEERR